VLKSSNVPASRIDSIVLALGRLSGGPGRPHRARRTDAEVQYIGQFRPDLVQGALRQPGLATEQRISARRIRVCRRQAMGMGLVGRPIPPWQRRRFVDVPQCHLLAVEVGPVPRQEQGIGMLTVVVRQAMQPGEEHVSAIVLNGHGPRHHPPPGGQVDRAQVYDILAGDHRLVNPVRSILLRFA
jgi:hypothetical protein